VNILSVILFFIIAQVMNDDYHMDRYLRQGIDLERQGKTEQALQLWDQAIGELSIPSLTVATEYLRVATEYEHHDYYRTAFMNYLWALSGSGKTAMVENKAALDEELARLEPLMDRKLFKRLKILHEENNPALFEELFRFWKRLDLTPGTLYNERLIEHWQRIAKAREQFTRKNDPPYGTDDRGRYYVKYGEPDRVDSGRVDITDDKIRLALNHFKPQAPECSTSDNNNYNVRLISNRIKRMFINPDYELWTYGSPNEKMNNNLVLIFGNRSGGTYERLQTLEDFMPPSAFSLSVARDCRPSTGGPPSVPPGMVLQMIFYEHFFSKDPFFAHLNSSILSELTKGGRGNTWPEAYLALNLRQRNLNQTIQLLWRHAPDEISSEEKRIASIPMDVYQYRLLNEENHPVFATFVESRPLQAIFYDFVTSRDIDFTTPEGKLELDVGEVFDSYQLTHGIQLRDEHWGLAGQNRQSLPLAYEPGEDSHSSSIFVIPWLHGRTTQVFYSELTNFDPHFKPRSERLFPDSLRGLGKLEIEQPEPLSVRDGELIAGDLIIGYGKNEKPADHSLFKFIAANDGRIPEGENIVIHFEVYQLQSGPGGIARFEVEYEIRPRDGLFGWTGNKQDEFNITLDFETDNDRFTENLEIEAADLGVGKYELRWIIRDMQSGQKYEQKLHFEVVESIILNQITN